MARGKAADLPTLLVVTCGGAGLSPFAPGTVGTVVAWAAVAAAPQIAAHWWLVIAALAFAGGWYYVERAQRITGAHDAGWIVIDEAAAYWLIYGLVGGGIMQQAAIFFLFRFFDIVKPPPARRIDKTWHSSLGVMADDIVAALWTWGVLLLFDYFLA